MGFFSDIVDNVTDAVSDVVDAVGDFFSDPLGAIEDVFNASLDIMTFGTWSYAKDAVRDFVSGLAPEQTFRDRERSIRNATEPRSVIYGQVRTGGQIVYVEDHGKDNTVLWLCYVLASHECEEIIAVYADGEKVASSNGPNVNGLMGRPSNSFGDKISCWSIHGNRTTAFIPSITLSFSDSSYNGTFVPPNWGTNHKLTYQTYVWINLAFDKDAFADVGLPRFTFDVKGKNDILDPRSGLSGYTDNHGLVMFDLLRWDRMLDEPDTSIDLDTVINAANIADEPVPSGVGTTEKRYTVNGIFKLQAIPLEILKSVAAAGAAIPFFDVASGKWKIIPGTFQAPVLSFDESDLIGGISFQPGPPKNNRHNTAKGTYIDAAQNYEPTGFRELNITAYVNDDLETLEKSYDFPWTNSGTMARRLAKIDIERNRYGVNCKAVFKFKAVQLTPGDRIELSIAKLGWAPKIFRVEAVELSFEKGVALDLREDAAEIYDWVEGDALALDPPPTLSIPGGVSVSPPTNIVFEEELYQAITRSAIKVQLTLSWTDLPSALAYDIQFRLTGSTTWIDIATFWQDNSVTVLDVKDEPYDFRLRSINRIGVKSAWTNLNYTVIGKSAPPADVPILFIEKGILKWTYDNAPLDLAGFELRFQNGDRRIWVDATPVTGNIITETQFDVSNYAGLKTFMVKAIDTTGNFSNRPAVLVQNLGDPLINNIIVTQNEAPTWSGILTGGFINAQSEIEARPLSVFWGEPTAVFWPVDTTKLFWEEDYERVTYEFSLTVVAQDTDADITLDIQISGEFNENISYKPPGFTGDYLAFPGNVPAQEGVYTFLLTIPQQAFGAPPTIIDIVTNLDVEDIEESFNDVAVPSGGIRLPITKSYRVIKIVSLTLQDANDTAEAVVILDKDATLGPLVGCRDVSNQLVAGNLDATIQGY